MTLEQTVAAQEQRRCRAMIDVDLPALDVLLHEELVWIHGSGRLEDRKALLQSLVRDRPYRALVISRHSVRFAGDACISAGTIEISLAAADAPPPYFNLFTNIWVPSASGMVLVHAQSTRCPAPIK